MAVVDDERERWTDVDRYFDAALGTEDDALRAVREHSTAQGLPRIEVSAQQGAFLGLLVTVSGARRILEVGTLGGYSTSWLARALPVDGRVVTLELDPHHADVARANLAETGVADRVEVVVGPALDSLQRLVDTGADPFDLVFIDADKGNNPAYVEAAITLGHPGTVIVVDNVVRGGRVLDATGSDLGVVGTRRLFELVGGHPRLTASALQTVGGKGWDGFLVAVVR